MHPVVGRDLGGGAAVDLGDDAAQHGRGLHLGDQRVVARAGCGSRRSGRAGCRGRNRPARGRGSSSRDGAAQVPSICPTAASTVRPRPSDRMTGSASSRGPPMADSARRSAGRPRGRPSGRGRAAQQPHQPGGQRQDDEGAERSRRPSDRPARGMPEKQRGRGDQQGQRRPAISRPGNGGAASGAPRRRRRGRGRRRGSARVRASGQRVKMKRGQQRRRAPPRPAGRG